MNLDRLKMPSNLMKTKQFNNAKIYTKARGTVQKLQNTNNFQENTKPNADFLLINNLFP